MEQFPPTPPPPPPPHVQHAPNNQNGNINNQRLAWNGHINKTTPQQIQQQQQPHPPVQSPPAPRSLTNNLFHPPPPPRNNFRNQGDNLAQSSNPIIARPPPPPPPPIQNNAMPSHFQPPPPPPPRSSHNTAPYVPSINGHQSHAPPLYQNPPSSSSSNYPPPPPSNAYALAQTARNGYSPAAVAATKPFKNQSKIDPNQMPRPNPPHPPKQTPFSLPPYIPIPSPPNTHTSYIDKGNATPSFLRPISYSFPMNRNSFEKTKLPLCVFAQPMSTSGNNIPTLNSIQRCRQCQAYIHAACVLEHNVWICQFCQTRNTLKDYVDIEGKGVVEYNVTNTVYDSTSVRKMRLDGKFAYLYAVEYNSFMGEEILQKTMNILSNVANIHFQKKQLVGFILVDSGTQFIIPYLLNNQLHIASSCDIQDPFAFVPPEQMFMKDFSEFQLLLQVLKSWIPPPTKKTSHDCLGSLLLLIQDCLKDIGGGKAVIITSSIKPTIGKGLLHKFGAANNEKKKDDFYTKITNSLVNYRISIDLMHTQPDNTQHPLHQFIQKNYYIFIRQLVHTTGGRFCKLQLQDYQQLQAELLKSIQMLQAHDCILKLRVSTGVRVKKLHVPSTQGIVIHNQLNDELEIECAACTNHSVFLYYLDYIIGGIPEKYPYVHFQSAFLYTNIHGQRILRVATLSLTATLVTQEIFRFVDIYALSSCFIKKTCHEMLEMYQEQGVSFNTTKIKDDYFQQVIDILKKYRLHTNAISSPISQLILPDTCQLLPLVTSCTFKTLLTMVKGAGLERNLVQCFLFLYEVSPQYCFQVLYPMVYSLEGYADAELIQENEAENDYAAKVLLQSGDASSFYVKELPQIVFPSISNIELHKMYILDNGNDLIYLLHFPKETDVNFPKDLIQYLKFGIMRPRIPTIKILSQSNDPELLNLWKDDAGNGNMNYVDFLCFLHKKIRLALDKELGNR